MSLASVDFNQPNKLELFFLLYVCGTYYTSQEFSKVPICFKVSGDIFASGWLSDTVLSALNVVRASHIEIIV